MKVLIFGASGQLGRCLQDRQPEGWTLLCPSSSEVNITDQAAVQAYIENATPHLIINACAYNAVDLAQSNVALAMAVNAEGPRHVAQAAVQVGAKLLHVSTDYVFDGKATKPYGESACANPINVYGTSKRAGELAVLRALPDPHYAALPPSLSGLVVPPSWPTEGSQSKPASLHQFQSIVLRTAWLYSEYSGNFVKTMLRLAAQGKAIHVVDDQIGSPTYAGDLADAIIQLSQRPDVPGGIYHYSGATALSWHGFAQRIFQAAGLTPALVPITSAQYPSIAARPKYSALSCAKIRQYGIHAKPVDASLPEVVRKCLR
ncbi:MAG: NAD(P)-dependent oxidoreductase [Burkholderiaceae bacterium]|nr:MAG: NAD(P)-dependent oxidoreductase [Burkholderiaceae bacterium]TAM05053.1 MAG: NAD(P)-dependent oxidoreductase [Pusillimonas sp.]